MDFRDDILSISSSDRLGEFLMEILLLDATLHINLHDIAVSIAQDTKVTALSDENLSDLGKLGRLVIPLDVLFDDGVVFSGPEIRLIKVFVAGKKVGPIFSTVGGEGEIGNL
jgi:hypothetical protein